MKIEQDVEFLKDFDLQKDDYRPFLDSLNGFDWSKNFLDRNDGLSLHGTSKVIFYDHFWAGKEYGNFSEMYGVEIDEHSKNLRSLSYPILDNILKIFSNSTYIKGEISCCFPNSEQSYHIDPRTFHRFAKRIHLPLVTNSESFLDIEDKSFHLERGKLYEFNNMKSHRSKNLGETHRIHIIVDIIELTTLERCKKMFGEQFYSKVNHI